MDIVKADLPSERPRDAVAVALAHTSNAQAEPRALIINHYKVAYLIRDIPWLLAHKDSNLSRNAYRMRSVHDRKRGSDGAIKSETIIEEYAYVWAAEIGTGVWNRLTFIIDDEWRGGEFRGDVLNDVEANNALRLLK